MATSLSEAELLEQATRHTAAGQLIEAGTIYRQLLAAHPGHPDLLNALGLLGLRGADFAAARDWLELAIAAAPAQAFFHNNLGLVLHALGEFEPALASFERALHLDPSLAVVFYNAGNTRFHQRRFADAAACYRQALSREPEHLDALLQLGLALSGQGDLAGAASHYREALLRLPAAAQLWNNLGNVLKLQQDWDGAAAAYRCAIERDPGDALATNNLADARKETGWLDEALALFRRSCALDAARAEPHGNLLAALSLDPAATRESIASESRRWWLRHGAPLRPATPPTTADRSPDRRLRIGWVSPDFREHPVARHLLPVLRAHDPRQVEFVCYSDADPGDATTEHFRAGASLWRESAGWSHERLAAQVREDRIDLLFDLALHTAGNRLPMFARQPAPIQVSFAGYPGATGLETIAWRLTDRFLEPPEASAGPEFGRAFRLPDSFWLFDPLGEMIEVGERVGEPDGEVVFGCLSRFCKVSAPALRLWGELLLRVPHSRLLLLCPPGSARDRVLASFAALGLERRRIDFTGPTSRLAYLALYRSIDVVLDPFPYQGHMTTCDALWMGVPVVSLAGETPVSRGGLSLLSNLGLPELVAFNSEDYLRIAADLAADRPRRVALRAGLRARLAASPLMDAPRFTRGFEAACRAIWRQWLAEGAA